MPRTSPSQVPTLPRTSPYGRGEGQAYAEGYATHVCKSSNSMQKYCDSPQQSSNSAPEEKDVPASDIAAIIDLDRYPLDRLGTAAGRDLVRRCRSDLASPTACSTSTASCSPPPWPAWRGNSSRSSPPRPSFTAACTTSTSGNRIEGVPADHPALIRFETINRTICADQIPGSLVVAVYEWPELARFLAAVMDKQQLHAMADPLARANVMAYRDGEALNWHFDRSEFTTTLLIQAPEAGGEFQYRPDLRSDGDPNYDGVAKLVQGRDGEVKVHCRWRRHAQRVQGTGTPPIA